jgi:hypothetical protein
MHFLALGLPILPLSASLVCATGGALQPIGQTHLSVPYAPTFVAVATDFYDENSQQMPLFCNKS